MGAVRERSSATGIDGDQADDSAPGAGAVYVFARSAAGQWSQQAYVKASNTGVGDYFGSSLPLSGDGHTLAVGAGGERSSATGIDGNQTDDSLWGAGAVYVYTRSATDTWAQEAYIKASNTGDCDGFGASLALSGDGNVLAVGAGGEDSGAIGIGGTQTDDSASNAGAAYVFVRSTADQWSQQAYIKASNTGDGDGFGSSLALSGDGNTLAVGACREDSNATGIGGIQTDDSASNAGAAYVFVRNTADQWIQQAYIKASNTDAGDNFGVGLVLSGDGNTLVVSASGEDSSATGIGGNQASDAAADSGAAYVFVRGPSGQWSQRAYVKAPNTDAGDRSGAAVLILGVGAPFGDAALSRDGNTLAISAALESSGATGISGNQADDLTPRAGAVYLY